MTEILNERGRARAGGASLLAAERDWRERRRATSSTGALGAHRRTSGEPERAAQACLQPNAIGENAGENADEPRVRRAHSVRTGERVVRTQDLMTQRAALRHHSARGRA